MTYCLNIIINYHSGATAKADRRKLSRLMIMGGLMMTMVIAMVVAMPSLGFSQSFSVDLGDNSNDPGNISQRIILLVALITLLSLAPSLLIAVTCFTRIIIVLSLLRTAIGLQSSPPNSVLIGLALFLSLFIMAPTINKSYVDGIEPLISGKVKVEQALPLAAAPFHKFMLSQVRQDDLLLFARLGRQEITTTPEQVQYSILLPAFMISELRRAFEIGFLLFLPFIIIDLVVASLLMSMGMMMLPPIIVSLPFKLIFFVMADGWHLLADSLVKSFAY